MRQTQSLRSAHYQGAGANAIFERHQHAYIATLSSSKEGNVSILRRRPQQIPSLLQTITVCFVLALRTTFLQKTVAMKPSICVVLALFGSARAVPAEHRLYEDLMSTYDPRERPVQNSSAAIVIYLGITLNQIIDLNEKDQVLTVNAWLKYVSACLLCTLEPKVTF